MIIGFHYQQVKGWTDASLNVHLYWHYFSTSVFSIPFFPTWWTAQRTPTSWLARWNLKIKKIAVDKKNQRKWVKSYSSDFFTLFCSMWFPGLEIWQWKLYSFFHSLSFSLLCVRTFTLKKGNPTNPTKKWIFPFSYNLTFLKKMFIYVYQAAARAW